MRIVQNNSDAKLLNYTEQLKTASGKCRWSFLPPAVCCKRNYAGCPQRAARVKKRVGYLFIFLHHSRSQMVMFKLIEPGLKPD